MASPVEVTSHNRENDFISHDFMRSNMDRLSFLNQFLWDFTARALCRDAYLMLGALEICASLLCNLLVPGFMENSNQIQSVEWVCVTP